MEIFTALIGDEIPDNAKAVSADDRNKVQQDANDLKENGEQAALLTSEININPTDFCGHNDWKWIDHQSFSGYVLRCKHCRTWLFISQDESLFFRNLNDKTCKNCDSNLFPLSGSLSQCINCEGYMKNDQYYEPDLVQEIFDDH